MALARFMQAETDAHKRMKHFYFEALQKDNDVKVITLEKRLDGIIADIYLETSAGKVALEAQHSRMNAKEAEDKINAYSGMGIHCIYILDKGEFLHGKNSSVSLTEFELCLHRLYQGRVYYLDLKEGVTKAFHFDKEKQAEEPGIIERIYGWCIGEEKTNGRNMRLPSNVEVESHKLLLKTCDNGLRIARFNDRQWWRTTAHH